MISLPVCFRRSGEPPADRLAQYSCACRSARTGTRKDLKRLQRGKARRRANMIGANRPNLRPIHEARETRQVHSGCRRWPQTQAETPQGQREAAAAAEAAARQPWRQPVAAQYGADVKILARDTLPRGEPETLDRPAAAPDADPFSEPSFDVANTLDMSDDFGGSRRRQSARC